MGDPTLEQKIEAVLFFKAAPVNLSVLEKMLTVTQIEIIDAITALTTRLSSGATRVLNTGDEVCLVVAPELTNTVEIIRKDDLKRDIGKAGAETLSIVLYRAPVTRGEIDRIRGVNSAYILRNLEVRGLVARNTNSKRVEYTITPALLQHLGVTSKQQLPQYETILNTLDTFEAAKAAEEGAL